MLHYIILFLALLVLLLVQKNRKLLQEVIKISKNVNDNNINIFEKRENLKVKKGLESNMLILDKDIVVYDDWEKELQLVIFPKNADSFPFLTTIKKDVDVKEATEIFNKMKECYDKGDVLYVLPDNSHKEGYK